MCATLGDFLRAGTQTGDRHDDLHSLRIRAAFFDFTGKCHVVIHQTFDPRNRRGFVDEIRKAHFYQAGFSFFYTPLKRLTWLNTAVGAIPGALPPLMGWAASRGQLEGGGWALFAILVFWQMPHFFAIAWMYKDEYAKAGFKMLPSVDPDGSRTAQQAVSHTMGLLLVSLSPFVLHMAGKFYLVAAIFLGGYYLWCAIQFGRKLDHASAKKLFFASIIYLPLLLIALVADKL